MAAMKRALGVLVMVAATASAVGCGDDAIGSGTEDVSSGLAFHAEAEPLSGFAFDTGLVPAGSPAQISLKLSAGGALRVDAKGQRAAEGLAGVAGSGKLALDVHVKMDGRLKVDSALKKYDGDLPGLKDIDIPIRGEIAFDPFLVGDGESAALEAAIPATELPPIPLGSVPGSLKLKVAEGSKLSSSFHGMCVSVAGGTASYAGEAVTSGKLVLEGSIALELPAPLNKEVDLGTIEVPVPELKTPLDLGTAPAAGVPDSSQGGACAAAAGGEASGEGAEEPGAVCEDSSECSDGRLCVEGRCTAAAFSVTANVGGRAVTATAVSAAPATRQGIAGYKVDIALKGANLGPNAKIGMFLSRLGTECSEAQSLVFLPDDGSDASYVMASGDWGGCGLEVTKLPTAKDGTIAGVYGGYVSTSVPGAEPDLRLQLRFEAPVTR